MSLLTPKINCLKYSFFFVFALLFSQFALAGNMQISGKIENAKNETASLRFKKDFLIDKWHTLEIQVKNGIFSETVELENPTMAQFIWRGEVVNLYLEAGQTVELNFFATMFTESLKFTDANNRFLRKFNQEFADDFSTEKIAELIDNETVDSYEMALFSAKRKQKKFLKNYQAEQTASADKLSDDFVKYLQKHIKYHYLNSLLKYSIKRSLVYEKLQIKSLPNIMLDVYSSDFQDDSMLSDSLFRDYLSNYMLYFAAKDFDYKRFEDFSQFTTYNLAFAKENFSAKQYQFVSYTFFYNNCNKLTAKYLTKAFSKLSTVYKNDVSVHCRAALKKKPAKKQKGKKNKELQKLKLLNQKGEWVDLSDYSGKVLYIDFWASWCGPCRRQFPFAKKLQQKFSAKQLKQIVFLYISIDKNKQAWERGILQNQPEGEQLHSPGNWKSDAVKFFKISSIPRYMLIDKNGKIIDPNAKRPSDPAIFDDILRLID